MLDSKDFLKGFMAYLSDYYGFKEAILPASLQPNLPKLPLFQQTDQPVDMAGLRDMETDMEMQGMGGMGDAGGLLGATGGMDMGMPQELNGLFPGPYDPMRMN
jgi:hypothetical protein